MSTAQQRPSLQDESYSDLAASAQSLRDAQTSAEAACRPPPADASPDELARWDKRRFSRMISICGGVHLAVETAIKAYTPVVAGRHASRGGGAHAITDLLEPLGPRQRRNVIQAMGSRSPADISPWRTAALHIREPVSRREIQRITPQFAASMIEAAASVGAMVCGAVEQRFGPHEAVDDMSEALEDIKAAGAAAALRSQRHVAEQTYARYGVSAPAEALAALSADASVQRLRPQREAVKASSASSRRQEAKKRVCGRRVKSTGKRCILVQGHRGHCRSVKRSAAP